MKCAVLLTLLLGSALAVETSYRLHSIRDRIQARVTQTQSPEGEPSDPPSNGVEGTTVDQPQQQLSNSLDSQERVELQINAGMSMAADGSMQAGVQDFAFSSFFQSNPSGTSQALNKCFYVMNPYFSGAAYMDVDNGIGDGHKIINNQWSNPTGALPFPTWKIADSSDKLKVKDHDDYGAVQGDKVKIANSGLTTWGASDQGRWANNCRLVEFSSNGKCLSWPTNMADHGAFVMAACGSGTTLMAACRFTPTC